MTELFRKKKLIISAIILVALGIWMASRWHVWFGNPPEPAYQTQNAPHRVMLTMGNQGEFSRMVSWQAGESLSEQTLCLQIVPSELVDSINFSTDSVWLSADSQPAGISSKDFSAKGSVVNSRSGKTAFYSVALDSLVPGTTYRYQIISKAGNTDWKIFKVQKDSLTPFSFSYLADVQDSAGGLSKTVFSKIYTLDGEADCLEHAFCLFGGDLIERPMDSYWDLVFKDMPLSGNVPVVACTGNHEYLKGITRKVDARFPYVFPYYQQSAVDNNLLYTFAYRNARIFILDTDVDVWHLFAQRDWLEQQLAASKETWKILMLHHPVYSNVGKYTNVQIRWFFESLIRLYGVQLVLQGHEHVYARRASRDEAGKQSVPLFISSTSSPKIYHLNLHRAEDRVGTDDRFLMSCKVYADSLAVSTFLASDGSLYDKVVIKREGENKYDIVDYFGDKNQKVEVSDWYSHNKSSKRIKEFEQEVSDWKKGVLKQDE